MFRRGPVGELRPLGFEGGMQCQSDLDAHQLQTILRSLPHLPGKKRARDEQDHCQQEQRERKGTRATKKSQGGEAGLGERRDKEHRWCKRGIVMQMQYKCNDLMRCTALQCIRLEPQNEINRKDQNYVHVRAYVRAY
mmetsp:Transcript_16811/g.35059  ORF Transcript_16811/g.35059 Transcript_16811/m.35059 type:complete len:137 (+) Transcript_16811:357-767(+)